LIHNFLMVFSGILGFLSITYPALNSLGYAAFFLTGFGFSGMYCIIVNLTVPLFPDRPGRTLAVLYGIFSLGIAGSPQIGKWYVLLLPAPQAWMTHIFTWSASGVIVQPLLWSWTKKFHAPIPDAPQVHIVLPVKEEKQKLVISTQELKNVEDTFETAVDESGSICSVSIKSQYTFMEGLGTAKKSFTKLLHSIAFWQLLFNTFAFGWCLPPSGVFQVTMKNFFGVTAEQSSDIFTIINFISPIPRIFTSLAIDMVKCTKFPHGAKNVTILVFAVGIGVGVMMRFYAWESQTLYVLGMVYIYFVWNSFPPLTAVLSSEAFASDGKEALGLIFTGFGPGSLVGTKVERTVGIVQYYNYLVVCWSLAILNIALITMKVKKDNTAGK